MTVGSGVAPASAPAASYTTMAVPSAVSRTAATRLPSGDQAGNANDGSSRSRMADRPSAARTPRAPSSSSNAIAPVSPSGAPSVGTAADAAADGAVEAVGAELGTSRPGVGVGGRG